MTGNGADELPPGPGRNLVHLFRRLRARRDFSNAQIASRARLSPSYVSEVLNGRKTPRPVTAARLATALHGTDDDVRRARIWAEEQAELEDHQRQLARRQAPPPAGPAAEHPLPPVRFRLLGPVRAGNATGPVDIGSPTARAVLAVLLIRGEAGASTDEIISAVWGGPGQASRDSVYHYLSGLRRSLAAAGASLETRQPRYRLAVEPDTVDWHRFRRLASAARSARESKRPDQAAALLRAALALWTGPPLADASGQLDTHRHEMTRQRRAAVEALAMIEAELGHPDEVLALLHDEVSAGPVRERMAALLIDALTAVGQRDDASEIYLLTRSRLASTGLEPGAELQAAHRRALDSSASSPEPAAPGPAPGSPVSRPAPISGVPRLDPHFTGRAEELRTVVSALSRGGGHRLCAIYGMGGSGKTALAVRAAGALARSFPDGTVFLDLHGYTEQHEPLTAGEVLDRVLRRMRVDGAMIPADDGERAAFFRDLLHQRRMLFVLDNARDTSQVTPLLADAPGCAVILTSRRRLMALDDAFVLALGNLPLAEATALFRSVAGQDRCRGETADEQLASIADRCGRLPLAIRIAAARYRSWAQGTLTGLEEKLTSEEDRLAELDDEDRSVAASFRVSLRELPPPLARLFALLSVHPGTDFDALAAAALADVPQAEAARQLGQLADRHLVTENTAGRFRFHDLIGAFASRYARESVSAADRAEALRRLVDYFLRAAEAADRLITPFRYRVPIEVLGRAAALPPLGDYDSALEWLTDERGNLTDACLAAGAAGFDAACWQLAYTLRGYYYLTKSWRPWIATHETAESAAHRGGDVRAEAMIVNNLGLAQLERGSAEAAAACYRQAEQLFAAVPDPHGENTARANLAWLLYGEHRYSEFIAAMRPVLAFYEECGAVRNAAITLRGIGLAKAALGQFAESAADLRHALEVFTRMGLRLDIAMTWNGLGETHQRAGDSQLASAAFTEALTTGAGSGSEFEQARAHHRLGELAAGAGDPDTAREHWAYALDRYRLLGVPQAAEVQAALEDLETHR